MKAKQLDRFKRWLELNGRSRATIRTYVKVVRMFFEEHDKFTEDNILDWLLNKKLDVNSVLVYVSALKAYARFSGIDIDWDRVPSARVKLKGLRALSRDEVQRLFDVCDKIWGFPYSLRNKLILRLAYDLALRVSELLSLRVNDIDLESGVVDLRRVKRGSGLKIPLDPDTLALLKWYLKIFKPKYKLFEITADTVFHVVERACRAVGIKRKYRRYGLHLLRHSRLTHLLEDGWNIREIQEFAGHRLIVTTQRYLKVDVSKLAEKKVMSYAKSPKVL